MRSLTDASWAAISLTCDTDARSVSVTPDWMSFSCDAAAENRAASSPARPITTLRAAMSCGRLARSTIALSNAPADWPTPSSPPANTASSCCSWSSRVASNDDCEREVIASRDRNWS